jgi:hypothetical protein
LYALTFTLSLVYYVKDVGLSPLQMVLVGTVLEASCFLFEIPTGIVADLYSRRLSHRRPGLLAAGLGADFRRCAGSPGGVGCRVHLHVRCERGLDHR